MELSCLCPGFFVCGCGRVLFVFFFFFFLLCGCCQPASQLGFPTHALRSRSGGGAFQAGLEWGCAARALLADTAAIHHHIIIKSESDGWAAAEISLDGGFLDAWALSGLTLYRCTRRGEGVLRPLRSEDALRVRTNERTQPLSVLCPPTRSSLCPPAAELSGWRRSATPTF